MSNITKFVFEVMLVVRGRFCRNFYSDNMGNKFPTLILFLYVFPFYDEGGAEYMFSNLLKKKFFSLPIKFFFLMMRGRKIHVFKLLANCKRKLFLGEAIFGIIL